MEWYNTGGKSHSNSDSSIIELWCSAATRIIIALCSNSGIVHSVPTLAQWSQEACLSVRLNLSMSVLRSPCLVNHMRVCKFNSMCMSKCFPTLVLVLEYREIAETCIGMRVCSPQRRSTRNTGVWMISDGHSSYSIFFEAGLVNCCATLLQIHLRSRHLI